MHKKDLIGKTIRNELKHRIFTRRKFEEYLSQLGPK